MSNKTIAQLRAELSMATARFEKGLKRSRRSLQVFWTKAQRFGRDMQSLGQTITTRVALPLALLGASAVTTAGNFEAAMNRVEVKAGATGQQLGQMREQALELGRTTQFSASEAAAGFEVLSQAGFKARQSMAALPQVLNFAAAAELELGEAAGVAADTLGQFQLDVSQTGRIADVLVKAANSANQTVRDLAESFKFAGPVAKEFNLPLEESAAVITTMAKAGIRGSMAGTALRKMFTSLANPSDQVSKIMSRLNVTLEESPGKLRNLNDILGDLGKAGITAGEVMQVFGDRAGPGAAKALAAGIRSIRELQGSLENAGGEAARNAAAKMKGFNGELKKLASAWEGLQLAIANAGLLELATRLTSKLTDFVSAAARTNPELLRMATGLALAVGVSGPLLIMVGMLVEQVSKLGGAVTRFAVQATASVLGFLGTSTTAILGFLTGPLGLSVLALSAAGAAWMTWGDDVEAAVSAAAASARDWFAREMPETFALAGRLLEVSGKVWTAYQAAVERVFEVIKGAATRWGERFGLEMDEILKDVDGFGSLLMAVLPTVIESAVTAAITKVEALASGVNTVLDGLNIAWQAWGTDVLEIVKKTVSGIREELVGKLQKIVSEAGEKISAVTGFFREMWIKVQGNSYVPDMVEGIGNEFGKLQKYMAVPAAKATELVSELFRRLDAAVGGRLGAMLENIKGKVSGLRDLFGSAGGGASSSAASGSVDETLGKLRKRLGEIRAGRGPGITPGAGAGGKSPFKGLSEAGERLGQDLEQSLSDGIGRAVEAGKFRLKDLRSSFGSALGSASGRLMASALGSFGPRGKRSGIFGGLSNLLGFKNGGGFRVGGPGGAFDGNLVAFMANKGEDVEVFPQGARGRGDTYNFSYNFPGGITPAELRPMLAQSQRETVAMVADSRARGGSYGRGFRGR